MEESTLATIVSFLAFLAIWVLVSWCLSRLGGWYRLQLVYRAHHPAAGERFHFRSARLGAWCGYNNCLTFSAGPGCLHMAPFPPLLAAHPPLCLPWAEVRTEAGTTFGRPTITLHLAREASVTVTIPRALAEGLARASGGAFALPPAV